MAEFGSQEEVRQQVAVFLREHNLAAAENAHPQAQLSRGLYERVGKRLIDVVVSGAALIVTAPFNLVVAVLTFADVGSPIFFHQQRVGKDGKPISIVKFRNMTNECDEHGELLPPEQRVTRFGRFMRASSADELLNFWSIFKGDMSIIGPRPLLPEYTERYCSYHRARLAVKPGLECPLPLGQEDACGWEAQLSNDAWYAQNVSFSTDLRMFARLVHAVFDRKTAATRGAAGRSWFVGYDEQGHALSMYDVPQDQMELALKEFAHE